MTSAAGLRVGIDIGGTFTDLSVLDSGGIVAIGKALTTHKAPAEGVVDALESLLADNRLDPRGIDTLIHGTTLVTNALIERRGARTAVLTTAGFRDVIEMGREHRYELYDLEIELPRPLVPRRLRIGVGERTYSTGEVVEEIDEQEVRDLVAELDAAGVEAIAVCFIHSHVNDANERRVQEIIAEAAPHIRVALSSAINPEVREYERFSTTVANVYVQRVVEDYLSDLRSRLASLGVADDPMIMLSNGGITSIDVAQRFPIRMLESGPAGGALGAVAFGRTAGESDLLAFDMGGTTAKLCIIEDSQPLIAHTFEVSRLYKLKSGSGLPVRAPVIDMIEIGAGGGSIARVGSLGLITIGPDSAGSDPGPVCYGQGGKHATVTDADVVLGFLDPDNFLGGRMQLDAYGARRAITEQIAEPLGISCEEAAWGIHATVNANMANAARVHAIERGKDADTLPLFASGGNGPLHGPGVAQALGCPSVIVPPAAGVLSTLGFLVAAPSIDMARSQYMPVDESASGAAQDIFASLEAEGGELLHSSGVNPADIRHARSLDMRFNGQGAEVEVPVPSPGPGWLGLVQEAFVQVYAQKYGDVAPGGVDIEILTWRVRSSGPEPDQPLGFTDAAPADGTAKQARQAYFPSAGGYLRTPVHDRYGLAPGTTVTGPALVEEHESTLLVPPDASCTVLDDLSICIDLVPQDDADRKSEKARRTA